MTDAKCYQATPHGTLLEQIMDSMQQKKTNASGRQCVKSGATGRRLVTIRVILK